jgi:hypothetical protein
MVLRSWRAGAISQILETLRLPQLIGMSIANRRRTEG